MEATPLCPYIKARSMMSHVVHQPAGHSCPVQSQGRSKSLRHITLKAKPAGWSCLDAGVSLILKPKLLIKILYTGQVDSLVGRL